jgi:hypothetical protein
MKTKFLNFRLTALMRLIIGLCCFLATSLNAQGLTYYYKDGTSKVTATSDSRLVASIEETNDSVTIKVFGIGQMRFDAVEFAFFLNEDVLKLTDRTFLPTLPYGRGAGNQPLQQQFRQAIDLNPALQIGGELNVDFSISAGAVNYRKAGAAINDLNASSIEGFDALFIPIMNLSSSRPVLERGPGEMIHFFTVYFKKASNAPIQKTDIGIGAKTDVPGGDTGGAFSPSWVSEGHSIYYKYTTLVGGKDWHAVPELFWYRSASSVKTKEATAVEVTTATLNGEFQRGALSPATDLLDGENGVKTYTGRLDWDNIAQRGFFYSTSAVDLRIEAFADTVLFINGVRDTFPRSNEIAAGSFTRGSHTFFIKSANNADTDPLVAYSESLTGLTAATQYYAWAFTQARFQTSNPFPNIGERITFTTDPDCVDPPQPIADADQYFCPGATVSDLVATVESGATLSWFLSGQTTALDPITELTNNTSYFAGAVDGDCISALKPVAVTIKQISTASMITVTPSQPSICSGETATLTASAGSMDNPAYKWYASATGTDVLGTESSYTTPALTDNATYWVSVSNATTHCEGEASSTGRRSVTVTVNPYSTSGNVTVAGETICSGQTATLTATSTGVTNPSYKWYSAPSGGNLLHQGASYTTGVLTADTTYYVSVSGNNYCEGDVRVEAKVTINCNTIRGTVFPLVFYNNPQIDARFAIRARLYALPPSGLLNPINYLQNPNLSPLYEATAVHYDSTVYVPGTPKNPGLLGSLINPGYPINWGIIGMEADPDAVRDTTTLRPNQEGALSLGLYSFSDVALGEYILVLSRPGFVSRYTKIIVGSGGVQFIEHRELIGGDATGTGRIESGDINRINSLVGFNINDIEYNARYDINGNRGIDVGDVSLVKFFQGFHTQGYQDTHEWLIEYRQP